MSKAASAQPLPSPADDAPSTPRPVSAVSTAPATPAGSATGERIVLVGHANVGKSLIFGQLSGHYVTVSNFPGTTVELTRGAMRLGARSVALVDTPGTNGLMPHSEDERVTRDVLLEAEATVLQVADTKNLDRALALTLQLAEAGCPTVLCLNMSDEAESLGLRPDPDVLARRLGIAVVPTVATRREGIDRLPAALGAPRVPTARVAYGPRIESALAELVPLLPEGPIAPRLLALSLLAGDDTIREWVAGRLPQDGRARLAEALRRLAGTRTEENALAIQAARMRAAEALAGEALAAAQPRARRPQPGLLTMHPVWGWPILAAVLAGMYWFVGDFGAQTAVGWLEEGLFGAWINPAVVSLCQRFIPWAVVSDFIAGEYGLITMGVTYAVAIVLPIVATFFVAFSVLEDSGYLPRLAVMLNRAFRVMGLNGRAVLPMILGLGCDTMATLTTRILHTRKERMLVILLLALGVPCSAQLGVILGMLSALSWKAAAVWAGVLVGVVITVGASAARILPGERADFVLEIPPLRVPSIGNILRKTMARIEWYLREAVPLFLVGTVVLFVTDRTGLLAVARTASEPIVIKLLGLPGGAAEAFLIGFLRRDFGAAGLYKLAENGLLSPVQTVVALITMTLFIPCIANFLIMVKEQGVRTATAVAAFIFPFAVAVGAAVNFVLHLTGSTLQ